LQVKPRHSFWYTEAGLEQTLRAPGRPKKNGD